MFVFSAVFSCRSLAYCVFFFFFFNDTATTEIYTLSLHDALPICSPSGVGEESLHSAPSPRSFVHASPLAASGSSMRSEEHTSELQSQSNLVCRLLLEKKNRPRCCISHASASLMPAATTRETTPLP